MTTTTTMTPDNTVTSEEAVQAIYAQYLQKPTAKTRLLAKLYQPPHNAHQPICDYLTERECAAAASSSASTSSPCHRVHFEVVRYPQTDHSLGHCSYLSTCHRTSTCKYLHFRPIPSKHALPYEWQCDHADWTPPAQGDVFGLSEMAVKHPPRVLLESNLEQWVKGGKDARPSHAGGQTYPPQWINADLQTFDLTILGKFDVIVQDTAFDIHMSLPYGTMTDAAVRAMPIQHLQDSGLLFFWVTGRAMELGRELLKHWGYSRVDELTWVKTNQVQRVIRSGRSGHWLNHSKEHCLVGIKGSGKLPDWVRSGLDCDVLVAEVRETSRKPDEMYGIIERLAPGSRKLELFGRKHNARSGWLTIGDQLKSDQIYDPELKRRVEEWRLSRGEQVT